MKTVVLRFDAPFMSFGGVIVDQHGFSDRFPGTAMLTGLIANALGWVHRDTDRLDCLQNRVMYAARWDVPPTRIVDYQTVDMAQAKMRDEGWTTRGRPEHRTGGAAAKFGIHQRYRHYWMDGLMTVVLALNAAGDPDVDALATALRRPARPLFLGRKTCLPSRPLLDPKPLREGANVLAILREVPVWNRSGEVVSDIQAFEACWPPQDTQPSTTYHSQLREVFDRRDWVNQLPAGSTIRMEGVVTRCANRE